jgi:hypothetical protein
MRGLTVALALALAACASDEAEEPVVADAQPPQIGCAKSIAHAQQVSGRGQVTVWAADGAYFFTSHMFVNADGAPDAYKPDRKGLSYVCDGAVAFENNRCVWPESNPDWQSRCNAAFDQAVAANWQGDHMCVFGWRMKGGRQLGGSNVGGAPLIQGARDPAPGNYVSTTSMTIAGAPEESQRRYVNSREIPFFVLSRKLREVTGAKLGSSSSVGVVYRPSTDAIVYAVFADVGPSWQIGEGSIALHYALGGDPISKIGGVDRAKRNMTDDIVYVVLPRAMAAGSLDHGAFRAEIAAMASAAFKVWGGREKLKLCLEE